MIGGNQRIYDGVGIEIEKGSRIENERIHMIGDSNIDDINVDIKRMAESELGDILVPKAELGRLMAKEHNLDAMVKKLEVIVGENEMEIDRMRKRLGLITEEDLSVWNELQAISKQLEVRYLQRWDVDE